MLYWDTLLCLPEVGISTSAILSSKAVHSNPSCFDLESERMSSRHL